MMTVKTKAFDLGYRSLVQFRPDSHDADIVRSILIDRTEYQLFSNCAPKVIFDIGAQIGCASLLFANSYPKATIYAFEPEPENYAILCENVDAYENVKPYNVALGAKTEKRPLFDSDTKDNKGGFSFHKAGSNLEVSKTVDVANIVDFIKSIGSPQIDLLKVDTEGCEHEILFRLYLDGTLPPFIMGEAHGVDDWKMFEFLSQSHNVGVNKGLLARCYLFYAARKDA